MRPAEPIDAPLPLAGSARHCRRSSQDPRTLVLRASARGGHVPCAGGGGRAPCAAPKEELGSVLCALSLAWRPHASRQWRGPCPTLEEGVGPCTPRPTEGEPTRASAATPCSRRVRERWGGTLWPREGEKNEGVPIGGCFLYSRVC